MFLYAYKTFKACAVAKKCFVKQTDDTCFKYFWSHASNNFKIFTCQTQYQRIFQDIITFLSTCLSANLTFSTSKKGFSKVTKVSELLF